MGVRAGGDGYYSLGLLEGAKVLGLVVLGMKVGDEVVLDVVPRKNPEIEWGEREGIMAGGILEVAKVCLGLPLVWGRPIFVSK